MKKSIILALVSVVSALSFVGCSEVTSDGLTSISYHAKYTILGDNPCEHAVGEEYIDAGITATLYDPATDSNIDITDQIAIDDPVDGDAMGIYSVTYDYTNKDGFSYAESRDVYVYDTEYDGYDISGTYTVQAGSYRIYGGTQTDFDGCEITIKEFLPGFFYFSDLFGGFYEQFYGYGSSVYAMTGYTTVYDTEVALLSSYVTAWGDSLDKMTAVYDATAKTITCEVYYVGSTMYFNIVLKLNEEESDDEA